MLGGLCWPQSRRSWSPLGAMLAPGATTAAQAVTCTSGVAVTRFSFSPPSVPPGFDSALTLVLQNCTSPDDPGVN